MIISTRKKKLYYNDLMCLNKNKSKTKGQREAKQKE